MAVAVMASSGGKNNMNAGSNKVPNPNPEKKLKKDPANAKTITMSMSTIMTQRKSNDLSVGLFFRYLN
jgi:hypothetical protein